MTAPNHIVGGFTFTGVFGSIVGINILQDWKYLVVVFNASQLPDIDHTKSLIGKFFYPIAKLINRRYGHRTITHSLIFLILSTALLSAFQAAYFSSLPITQIFFLSMSSHLIFDMMTIQGVPLFYPFIKNPCVLPGNPNMRLRVSDIRSETAVFSFFIVSAIFLQPLMKNGFWTSYNRMFGTVKHLKSEYNKSDDLLLVTFDIQEGSVISKHNGYCVSTDGSKMMILKDDVFSMFPKDNQKVTNVIPVHTEKEFFFESKRFINISIDSLNTLILRYLITDLELLANRTFEYEIDGIWKSTKSLKLGYLNHLQVKEIPLKLEAVINNPVIERLKQRKLTLIENDQILLESYNLEMTEYEEILQLIELADQEVEKEILFEKYRNIKEPEKPVLSDSKVTELDIKIKELEHEDNIRRQEYDRTKSNSQLQFSGYYETLTIQ